MKAEAEQQQVLAEEPAADRQSLTGDKRGHGPGPASLCSGRSGGMQDAAEAAGSRADACCPARRGTAEEGRAEVSISPGERGRTRPVTAGGAATGLLCASGNFRGERTQNACFLMFRGGSLDLCVGLCPIQPQKQQKNSPCKGRSCCSTTLPSLPASISLRGFPACSSYGMTFTVHTKRQKESWECTEGEKHLLMAIRPCTSQLAELGRKASWPGSSPN